MRIRSRATLPNVLKPCILTYKCKYVLDFPETKIKHLPQTLWLGRHKTILIQNPSYYLSDESTMAQSGERLLGVVDVCTEAPYSSANFSVCFQVLKVFRMFGQHALEVRAKKS